MIIQERKKKKKNGPSPDVDQAIQAMRNNLKRKSLTLQLQYRWSQYLRKA